MADTTITKLAHGQQVALANPDEMPGSSRNDLQLVCRQNWTRKCFTVSVAAFWRASRIIVPSVLLLAALGKATHWDASVVSLAKLVRATALPTYVSSPGFVAVVTVLETVAALGIVFGAGRTFRFFAWAGYVLSVCFLTLRLYLLFAGVALTCACFGNLLPTSQYSGLGFMVALLLFLATSSLVLRGDPLLAQTNTHV